MHSLHHCHSDIATQYPQNFTLRAKKLAILPLGERLKDCITPASPKNITKILFLYWKREFPAPLTTVYRSDHFDQIPLRPATMGQAPVSYETLNCVKSVISGRNSAPLKKAAIFGRGLSLSWSLGQWNSRAHRLRLSNLWRVWCKGRKQGSKKLNLKNLCRHHCPSPLPCTMERLFSENHVRKFEGCHSQLQCVPIVKIVFLQDP